MSEAKSAADVLNKTRETLAQTQLGLADFLNKKAPQRRQAGLHNVIVFGRSVTLVLQNMRTIDESGFNEWYTPFQKEMADDDLLKFFKDLRNEVLKEGPHAVGGAMTVGYVDSNMVNQLMQHAPPGTKGVFFGDQWGGNGFTVELPDGTEQKFYFDLPGVLINHQVLFRGDLPKRHLGQPLNDPSAETLCTLYVGYLSNLVAAAQTHFGS
jgi:hypothetical protein